MEYKTLAVPDEVWSFYPSVFPTKTIKREGGVVTSASGAHAAVTSLGVRDGDGREKGGDLPLSERVLGTPTAFAARIGEAGRASEARKRRRKGGKSLLVVGLVLGLVL